MAFNAALWEEKSKKRAVRVQQTLKREAITQKLRSEAVSAGMSQGLSWEDISKRTKVPLSFVKSYSQETNPNYGIKAPPPSLVSQGINAIKDVGQSLNLVREDLGGVSANKEKTQQLKNQLLNARKKAIMSSGVLSPETKKQALGKLVEEQRALQSGYSQQLQAEQQTLQRGQQAIKTPAAVGAGVKRSGEGLLQGIGGLTDLITPGQGQNRLTQFATRNAEGTDQFVKDNNMNKGAYLGGQLVGEALQMLTGAKAIKALSAVPGTAKILAIAGKADDLENALMAVNKGGKVGERAIKTARYLLDPAKVANIAGNTAVDQGQLAARGQDINPLTVGTSVAANYALGGVLDAAGAGLTRRATNKANKLQDAATAADNARLSSSFADGEVTDLLPTKIKVSERGGESVGRVTVVTPQAYERASARLAKNYEKEIAIASSKGPLVREKAIEAVDAKYAAMQDALDAQVGSTQIKFKGGQKTPSTSQATAVSRGNKLETSIRSDIERELKNYDSTLALDDVNVIGSVARGQARPDSDLDILITPNKDFFTGTKGEAPEQVLRNIEKKLQKRFNREVQINVGKVNVSPDTPTKRLADITDELSSPKRGAKTTGSALATERRAIEDAIVKELPDKAEYKTTSFKQDASDAIDLIKNDRAKAESIAFNRIAGNSPSHEVAVRKALELEARNNKDANLLQRLAQSESNTETSRAAQRLGAEGYNKDPESPVEAMKDVLRARKDTKLKGIPKELSADEAAKITNLADEITTKKAAIPEGSPEGSPERLEYGVALTNLRRYKNELIDGTKTRKEKVMPQGVLNATFGTAKSLKASLDNSFFGRQGLKVLTTHPTIWGKAFIKSWGDIGKGLKGIDALDALDANTLSRTNNINGRYGKMKLDIHGAEEAFPSSLPEKVPGLGRLFKASEYAYVGAAHRMRADLADQILEKAQKAGVDIDDGEQLQKIGKLINSMTGRGHLGESAEPAANVLNNLFFSPRNWKSNIDTITAHQFQKGTNILNRDKSAKFVRKEAAKNLLKMVAVVGATLAAAENFKPGSVEKDPRSSDFGKIKIGNTRFDVSGGMASIATVASRLATRETKSTTTGQVTKLNGDEFGARSTWDVLMDYAEGKMSPGAGAIKQILTGKNFIGEKVTPTSMAKDLLMPLPYANYEELKRDPKSANTLVAMISDALGVGTNTYSAQKDWNQSNTKKINGFKQTVDAKKFSEANNAFNEAYRSWLEKATKSEQFKKLPEQTQKTLLSQKSQDLTDEILKKYGYEYKAQRKSPEEKQTIKDLKGL